MNVKMGKQVKNISLKEKKGNRMAQNMTQAIIPAFLAEEQK